MLLPDFDAQLIGRLLDWGILGFAVKYLATIAKSLAKLNEKIAVLCERTDDHEKELDKHDARITHVERHIPIRRK